MSLKIDPERLAAGELTDDEYRILQNRCELPRHLPYRPELSMNDRTRDLAVVPNTGDANTRGVTQEDLDARNTLEDQPVPTIEDKGGIQENDTDYSSEEWNNDTRRAELQDRGLKITGRKADLIARLERSDQDELTEDDYEDDPDA